MCFLLSQNNIKLGWYMSFDGNIGLQDCWEKWVVETIYKITVRVEVESSLLLFIKKEIYYLKK